MLSKSDFVERLKSFGSTTPDPLSPEYDSYGFGMGEISGYIGHTGNGLGFEALVMYDRANDRTITILFNSSNPDDPDAPAHLFKQLLAILGWTPAGQIQVAADGTNAVVGAGTVWTGLVSGPFGARRRLCRHWRIGRCGWPGHARAAAGLCARHIRQRWRTRGTGPWRRHHRVAGRRRRLPAR